jgi:hypothetical protein
MSVIRAGQGPAKYRAANVRARLASVVIAPASAAATHPRGGAEHADVAHTRGSSSASAAAMVSPGARDWASPTAGSARSASTTSDP